MASICPAANECSACCAKLHACNGSAARSLHDMGSANLACKKSVLSPVAVGPVTRSSRSGHPVRSVRSPGQVGPVTRSVRPFIKPGSRPGLVDRVRSARSRSAAAIRHLSAPAVVRCTKNYGKPAHGPHRSQRGRGPCRLEGTSVSARRQGPRAALAATRAWRNRQRRSQQQHPEERRRHHHHFAFFLCLSLSLSLFCSGLKPGAVLPPSLSLAPLPPSLSHRRFGSAQQHRSPGVWY